MLSFWWIQPQIGYRAAPMIWIPQPNLEHVHAVSGLAIVVSFQSEPPTVFPATANIDGSPSLNYNIPAAFHRLNSETPAFVTIYFHTYAHHRILAIKVQMAFRQVIPTVIVHSAVNTETKNVPAGHSLMFMNEPPTASSQ